MRASNIVKDKYETRFREFLVLLDRHTSKFNIQQFTFSHNQYIFAKVLIFHEKFSIFVTCK